MKHLGGCIMTLMAVLSVWPVLTSAADQKTLVMGYDPRGT
jgi:hypothetical protein